MLVELNFVFAISRYICIHRHTHRHTHAHRHTNTHAHTSQPARQTDRQTDTYMTYTHTHTTFVFYLPLTFFEKAAHNIEVFIRLYQIHSQKLVSQYI